MIPYPFRVFCIAKRMDSINHVVFREYSPKILRHAKVAEGGAFDDFLMGNKLFES
ncbi:MAG: hypothetical protein CM1200mP18_17480 [Gammaproteobacteria bacterium]|nr:MAG: hypothetical protein CM1200mP18_17480 [Gammaproteobacteria bacterium]